MAITARHVTDLVGSIIIIISGGVEWIPHGARSAARGRVLLHFFHLNATFHELLWHTILGKTVHRLLIYSCAGEGIVDTHTLFD